MRNCCFVLLGLIYFGSVWIPQARAQQDPSRVEEELDPYEAEAHAQEDLDQMEFQQDPAEVKAEPSDKKAIVRLKRNELKDVEKEIKALRRAQQGERQAEQSRIRAEKQARLGELKLQDPVKYQEETAKRFERQKKREKVRKEKIEEGVTKPKMTHEQWLEYIKKRNPKMYELVVKKDRLEEELKHGDAPQGATLARPK